MYNNKVTITPVNPLEPNEVVSLVMCDNTSHPSIGLPVNSCDKTPKHRIKKSSLVASVQNFIILEKIVCIYIKY